MDLETLSYYMIQQAIDMHHEFMQLLYQKINTFSYALSVVNDYACAHALYAP